MRLITSSALARVMACPASASLPAAFEPETKPAALGNAVHAWFEHFNEGKDSALKHVDAKFHEAVLAIDMRGLDLANYSAEEAFAVTFGSGEPIFVRLKKTKDRTERYAGLFPETTIAGTADLVGISGDTVVVLDIKTGWGWLPDPSKSAQLRSLAFMAARIHGLSRAKVGFIIARDEHPYPVTEELGPLDLEEIEEELIDVLEEAHRVARDDEEAKDVTIGPHCKYCPSLRRCPAYTSIKVEKDGILRPIAPDSASLDFVTVLEAKARLARESLKALSAQEPIPLANGLVYGPRMMTRTSKETGEVIEYERYEAYKP